MAERILPARRGVVALGGAFPGGGGYVVNGTNPGAVNIVAGGTSEAISVLPSGTAPFRIGPADNIRYEFVRNGVSSVFRYYRDAANSAFEIIPFNSGGVSQVRGANSLNIECGYGGGGSIRLLPSTSVLIGTSTDSSNGKLQLATHTTAAGGIGFGTDISLYRGAANQLATNANQLSSTSLQCQLANGSVNFPTYAFNIDPDCGMYRVGTNSIGFATNGTNCLTLDASQNATFAGSVSINNTVAAAVGVASTHKVTMVIGGVTYYLLATNVP